MAGASLRDDTPVQRVTAMTGTLHRLLAIDAPPTLAADGPSTPAAKWVTEMEHAGRALGYAGREGQSSFGTRSILARHVLFHWHHLGFTTRQLNQFETRAVRNWQRSAGWFWMSPTPADLGGTRAASGQTRIPGRVRPSQAQLSGSEQPLSAVPGAYLPKDVVGFSEQAGVLWA